MAEFEQRRRTRKGDLLVEMTPARPVKRSKSICRVIYFLGSLAGLWRVEAFVVAPTQHLHHVCGGGIIRPLDQENLARRTTTQLDAIDAMTVCKSELMSLVQNAPSGTSTPQRLTKEILDCVRQLEVKCPTAQNDALAKIQGTWELLWTAQDPTAEESKKNWIINPIENQAYSNNPEGRANPLLPVAWQKALERAGWVSSTPVRSTQTIDVNQGLVRNIVALNLGRKNSGRRASIVVDIQAKPDVFNPRRINVKFDRCRIVIPPYLDWEFFLGWIGPIGWIQNVYVDDDLRITRGHKGSVFVLTRPRRATV